MATRTAAFIGTLAAAVIGGAALFVTAPATSLVTPCIRGRRATADSIDTPITPELTDFYKVQSWQPGARTLVKAQRIPDAPPGVQMYRIMYQSTDLQGNAIPVTALFAAPDTTSPRRRLPLVGFAHGTTGIGQMCGISHTPLTPQTPGYSAWCHTSNLWSDRGGRSWPAITPGWVRRGHRPTWWVPLEARGILDSMRAVLPASATTGNIAINASELGIYGKSQGGEAAMSALQLAPSYAPDLEIDGGVILAPGFTPPIQGVLDAVASNPTSTSQNMFVLLIAQSFAENYPDLVDLDDILSPGRRRRTACDHVAPTWPTRCQMCR